MKSWLQHNSIEVRRKVKIRGIEDIPTLKNEAKDRYKVEVIMKISKKRELQEISEWEIPVIISYNNRYGREEKLRSILKPFYTLRKSVGE